MGKSGSPILIEDGTVVGIYGNGFIMPTGLFASHICCVAGHKSIVSEKGFQFETIEKGVRLFKEITAPPAFGKTTVQLPLILKDRLSEDHIVYVSGPTRLVDEEIDKVLREKHNEVYKLKRKLSTVRNGTFAIVSHQALAKHLVNTPETFKKGKITFIIDESHVRDCYSILLRSILVTQYNRSSNVSVIFMTATPTIEEIVKHMLSRYEIRDIPVELKASGSLKFAINQSLEGLNELGHRNRVLVFLPTINMVENLTIDYKSKGYNTIGISRKNFEDVKIKLKTTKFDLILTTDISEVGANFDIDVVINTCERNEPTLISEERVELKTTSINLASYNQRRGRVGRTRKGVHIFQKGWVPGDEVDSVCWIEAQMLIESARTSINPQESRFFRALDGTYKLSTA